jgi:hypothetical protein
VSFGGSAWAVWEVRAGWVVSQADFDFVLMDWTVELTSMQADKHSFVYLQLLDGKQCSLQSHV